MIFVYSIPPGAAATHTATSFKHTPWSTRLGPARSQHGENRMRLDGFERSTRGTGSESRTGGGEILPRPGENQNDPMRSIACPPDARVERPLESTRRDDDRS